VTEQKNADKTFLALTVWREARGESAQVQAGIAHVILNRVRRPSWWGRDVMSVLFKKWQFSSLTDPRDKQLTTWPTSTDTFLAAVPENTPATFVDGQITNPVPGADSYYDISIPTPNSGNQPDLRRRHWSGPLLQSGPGYRGELKVANKKGGTENLYRLVFLTAAA